MSREEFKVIVSAIKSVYNNFGIKEKPQFDFWYSIIKDIDYNTMQLSVKEYVSTNKFSPTISDLRGICSTTIYGDIKDAGACWEEVIKAIGRYGMYRQDKLLIVLTNRQNK